LIALKGMVSEGRVFVQGEMPARVYFCAGAMSDQTGRPSAASS
jgi:hypothetical protein